MAHRLKIGDEVRVIKQLGVSFSDGFRIGSFGEVIGYILNDDYPYEVKNNDTKKTSQFKPQELEKITEAVKMNLPKTIYIQERDESDGFFISGTPEELSEEGIKVKVGKYKLEKVVTVINEIKVVE